MKAFPVLRQDYSNLFIKWMLKLFFVEIVEDLWSHLTASAEKFDTVSKKCIEF